MNTFIWLLIAVGAFAIEMATPSALVSIWFAVGAAFAAIISSWISSTITEILVFVVISGISFVVFRPLIIKYINVKSQNTNADRLIGYKGRLSEGITKEQWGALEISGIRYSVSSEHQESIDQGQWVKVVALKGARLVVEKDTEGEQ